MNLQEFNSHLKVRGYCLFRSKKIGITPSELEIILCVGAGIETKRIFFTQNSIASSLSLVGNYISRMIKHLKTTDPPFLNQIQNPEDKKSKIITLCKKGREEYELFRRY